MLSISTLHAVDYYTQDSNEAFAYYGEASNKAETDPAGRWAGALANRYFPAGQVVSPEHFAALFFGFDPITGVALTKSADQLGFDLWKAEQAVQKPELNEEAAKEARTRVQKLRSQLLQRERSGEHRHHRAGIDLTFSAPKCVFRPSWTVIPREAGHAFQSKLDSRRVATRGFWVLHG